MTTPSFYGVSTTMIFCRFGCPSRSPRPENVVYFGHTQQATQAGFRPCKRCRPDHEVSPAEAFPRFVTEQFAQLATDHPHDRIADLASRLAISTRQLERLVRRQTGQSPRQFLLSRHGQQ